MARERTTTLSEDYINRLFAKESEAHIKINKALKSDEKYGINVGAYEGKILQFLAQLMQARCIVEIGTLYGYSTLWMAQALPADGRLIAIEKSKAHFEQAKKLLEATEHKNKIELHCGEALEVLKGLKVTPDMVFIDADKANYKNYLDWAIEAVRPGGLIIGDNTFLFGHMIGEDRGERGSSKAIEAMSAFNESIAASDRLVSVMLPTYEGMTLAMKK